MEGEQDLPKEEIIKAPPSKKGVNLDTAREILLDRKAGMTMQEIAHKHGRNIPYVQRVLKKYQYEDPEKLTTDIFKAEKPKLKNKKQRERLREKYFQRGVMSKYIRVGEKSAEQTINVMNGFRRGFDTVTGIMEDSQKRFEEIGIKVIEINEMLRTMASEGGQTVDMAMSKAIIDAIGNISDLKPLMNIQIKAAREARGYLGDWLKHFDGIVKVVNYEMIINSFLSVLRGMTDEEYAGFKDKAIGYFAGIRVVFDAFEKEEDNNAEYEELHDADNNEQEQQPVP
jgi:hypothetical protein